MATSNWDGGGISALSNPSDPSKPSNCISFQKATADGFSMIDWQSKDGVYNCDPSNVVVLTNDYGQAATLADAGKTTDDIK